MSSGFNEWYHLLAIFIYEVPLGYLLVLTLYVDNFSLPHLLEVLDKSLLYETPSGTTSIISKSSLRFKIGTEPLENSLSRPTRVFVIGTRLNKSKNFVWVPSSRWVGLLLVASACQALSHRLVLYNSIYRSVGSF